MNTEIVEIAASCSEDKLLRRAIIDASEAMAMYFVTNRSTAEAIATFERLRSQFDEARERARSRRSLIDG